MIYVGIDDTDSLESRGTNQLARALADGVSAEFPCRRITRHQLLDDPRVPYTSKNGSASLIFETSGEVDLGWFAQALAEAMRGDFIPGSDPGLCVARAVPESVQQFGRRCQAELVTQRDARSLADKSDIVLLGLGGTEDGVIGALAAVGLAAGDVDGRVIHMNGWTSDLSGVQTIDELNRHGVAVRDLDTGATVQSGMVEIGKKLRPNWREGRCVLYVRRNESQRENNVLFEAVKLP